MRSIFTLRDFDAVNHTRLTILTIAKTDYYTRADRKVNAWDSMLDKLSTRTEETTKHPYNPADCEILASFTCRHTSPESNTSAADCLPSVGWIGRCYTPQDDGYLTQACVVPIETVGTVTDLECVKV